jgi:hypothetical protein
MTDVPAENPATMPEDEPITATVVEPELQTPPLVASLKTVALPIQVFVTPEIADGNGLTTIVVVATQPVPIE